MGPCHRLRRRPRRCAGSSARPGRWPPQSVARMDEVLPWFRAMPADQRSWVMLVAQAGVGSFVEWLRAPGDAPAADQRGLRRRPAGAGPLGQPQADRRAGPGHHRGGRGAGGELRRARARRWCCARRSCASPGRSPSPPPRCTRGPAETRGAWDARLQALLVDALLRGDFDETLLSRAAALGWAAMTPVAVVVGAAPAGAPGAVLHALQRAARHAGVDVLAGVHGDRLVVVLGGAADPLAGDPAAAARVRRRARWWSARRCRPGRGRRVGPGGAGRLPGRAGWPGAPRPVPAADLLPERALAGDAEARRTLVDDVYRPLAEAGGGAAGDPGRVRGDGGTLESAARALFVHPNTVRYRLRRVAEVTGRTPTDPRDLLTLRLALVLGRLERLDPARRPRDRTPTGGSPRIGCGRPHADTLSNCRRPYKALGRHS